MKDQPLVSIVIPCLNVESTINNIITEFYSFSLVQEIIVVDNNSTDKTGYISQKAGAKVFQCKEQGMGYAIKHGVNKSQSNLVMKIDGDIRNPSIAWIKALLLSLSNNHGFVSGYYSSDYDEFPVGNLVAKPLISIFIPFLKYIEMPLSGTYIFDKDKFNLKSLPNGWAFDLALLLDAHSKNGIVNQICIGQLNDRKKKISDYRDMAEELMRFILNRYGNVLGAE